MKRGFFMKYITVAVPCYNSEGYMKHCLDTLLSAKDDIEIIIINDGSKDSTGDIADSYATRFPETVRVIHQENGGHGEGVNQGVINATGLYYKVVDSDDWINEAAFRELIDTIKLHYRENTLPDIYVCNYVYEHASDSTTYTMKYDNAFPERKFITWDDMKRFRVAQCLMMHSVFFKTEFLKQFYEPLPKHTFFVDNLYMYRPLPHAKSLYYMNIDLYRYFIGRDDQSVNEKMVIKRLDQQMYVTSLMVKAHNLCDVKKQSKKLYRYMLHNMAIMMLINGTFSFMSKEKQKIDRFFDSWTEIKEADKFLYNALKYRSIAVFTLVPGKLGSFGRWIFLTGYKIVKRIVKFA